MLLKNRMILGLIALCTLFACKNFYKATTPPAGSGAKTIDSLTHQNRYYILRTGDQAFYLKNDKDVPFILKNKTVEVEAFLKKQNKKRSLEERLIETITFYYTIADN